MSTASDQITEYLSVGGLFNPEIMNQTQHEAVRDTLIKARDDIQRLESENAKLRDTVEQWKCRYYDVADAICRESNGIEDLCRQASALRADKSRLDWLDKNMTAGDSFQTFEKEVLIGEIRKAIDAAMDRQEKQLWRRSYE